MTTNSKTQPDLNLNSLTDSQNTNIEPKNEQATRGNLKKFLLEHGLLSIGLLLLTLVGTLFLGWFGAKHADKWIEELRYTQKNQQKNAQVRTEEVNRLQVYIDKIPNATAGEKARVSEQLKDIKNRAKSHIGIARDFYIWNYQAISIATASSIVAAVSLFFLSKKGWDNANKYVINVFIFAFGITVFAGISPELFKQEENISNNTRVYLAYIALDDRVNTYIATNQFVAIGPRDVNKENASKTNPVELTNIKAVIRSIDSELATLNNIYIGFDAKKIPNYNQLFNEVNRQN